VTDLLDAAGYGVVTVLVLVGLWATFDAVRRPQAAWQAVGARKWLWVLGMFVGTYLLFGLIFVLLYLGGVRKGLQAVQAGESVTP
jgi:hypothetical protein